MARAAIRHILFGAAAAGLLMGCVEGAAPGAGGPQADGAAGTAAPTTRRGGNQEVEAPDVFQVTETALWDGRPSLGGIWVASPDTKNPERVVMFNPANGKTVSGALFRRERDNPGPALQISSDAAEALGMLAGQPSSIKVTALRKVEARPSAPVEAPAAAPAEAASKPAAAAAGTAAIAAAALDAVDAGTPAPGADAAAGADAAPAVEPPKRKTWKERRAEAKAAREAEKAAKTAAAAAAAEGSAEAGPAATPDAAIVTAVETVPLDARSADVAAAADAATGAPPQPEKRKTRRQIKAEQDAAAAAAAAAPPPTDPVAQAPAPASGRPIQIASFSSEQNANRAVEALAKAGITARPRKGETGGKVVWSVIATGDQALLQSIRKAGFADAFFLQ